MFKHGDMLAMRRFWLYSILMGRLHEGTYFDGHSAREDSILPERGEAIKVLNTLLNEILNNYYSLIVPSPQQLQKNDESV